MSIMDCDSRDVEHCPQAHVSANGRPLHRVGIVRRLQGISRRTVARHLHTDISTVKQQEDATTDMPLSELYQWQAALEVPISELLVEADDSLSAPILERAQLIRLMKTTLAILGHAGDSPIREMAQTLVEQLAEIMPELREVSPWHAVGKRRSRDELGQAAERRLSEDVFTDGFD
jgi:transcriptional regulator with XRE-family HTH domain